MSGLSSRVMNMKFMQSLDKVSRKSNDDDGPKVKDISEWGLLNSSKLKKLAQQPTVVESIGYTSVNSFSSIYDDFEEEDAMSKPPARRTWGDDLEETDAASLARLKDSVESAKAKKPASRIREARQQTAESDADPESTKEFLDSLWSKKKKSSSKKRSSPDLPETPDVPIIKKKRRRLETSS